MMLATKNDLSVLENTPILVTHVGVNQFITEVYLPDKRQHRFSSISTYIFNHRKKAGKNSNIYYLLQF